MPPSVTVASSPWRTRAGRDLLPPLAHDLAPHRPIAQVAVMPLARHYDAARRPVALVERSGRRACCKPGAPPMAYCCSNRGSRLPGGRDEHTHPHGRAERSTPRSRTAEPRTGNDTSGGSPPGGAAAARLRSGGAPRAGAQPAGTNDRADSAHFAGFAHPAGAAPVPCGAASAGHRHRRWAPRRAALTEGPDQQIVGARDVVLRRTVGRSRSGALLSTYRWMRPRLRRRAALGCPPRAGEMSGPALAGDGAHYRRDLVADSRPGTPAHVAGDGAVTCIRCCRRSKSGQPRSTPPRP